MAKIVYFLKILGAFTSQKRQNCPVKDKSRTPNVSQFLLRRLAEKHTKQCVQLLKAQQRENGVSAGFEEEQLQSGRWAASTKENHVSKALLLPSERNMKPLCYSLNYITHRLFNSKTLLFHGNSSALKKTTNPLSSPQPPS